MGIESFSGKPLKKYGYEDLMRLNRNQLMELFLQLDAPGK